MRKLLLALLILTPSVCTAQLPDAVCQTLREERAKFSGDIESVCSEAGNPFCPIGGILNRVAWIHRADGWGLSRKTGGSHTTSPAGQIAGDILMKQNGQAWDVLIGWEKTARVTCSSRVMMITDSRRGWVAPVDPGDVPPPPPPPPPNPFPPPDPPPSDPVSHTELRLAITAAIAHLEVIEKQNKSLTDEIADLKESLEAHREESRKAVNEARNILKNWRTYVVTGMGVLGALIGAR